MSLMKKLKEGKKGLIVTREYEILPEYAKKKICNGAGPQGGWWGKVLSWIIPDHFFGLDLTEAFNIHDFMYFKGGNLWDKLIADMVMLYNMLHLIYYAGHEYRKRRYFMATRYFLAVFWGGKSSFNKK